MHNTIQSTDERKSYFMSVLQITSNKKDYLETVPLNFIQLHKTYIAFQMKLRI